jgi:biopolymer transport protein ExbB
MTAMRTSCLLGLTAILLGASASRAAAQASDLDTAYKRELAFLEAERNTLKARLAEVEREEQQKVQAARSELDQLQGRATHLALQGETLSDQMADAEDAAATQAETSDVLDGTLQQAEIALSKGGFKLPEVPEGATQEQKLSQLDYSFEKGIELLKRYSVVREAPGEFFTQSGKKVSGRIFHVGQVGAYGVADGVAGALAPAGEERLKVWPEGDSAPTARSLAMGSPPAQLNLFLFESLEKDVEQSKEKTWEDLMKAGGPIGWVIVILGVLAGLMALARIGLLARAGANTEKLLGQIVPLVKQRDVDGAVKVAAAARNPVGRVLEATLRNLHRPREQVDDVVAEAIMREQPSIDRFSSMIIISAAVGPLLGLLGTVTGMIATFDVITEYGNANPKLLAGGISEALVTTEFGLCVAIPALLIGNMLSAWGQRIKDDIDGAALRIVNVANGNDVADAPHEALAPGLPASLAPAE